MLHQSLPTLDIHELPWAQRLDCTFVFLGGRSSSYALVERNEWQTAPAEGCRLHCRPPYRGDNGRKWGEFILFIAIFIFQEVIHGVIYRVQGAQLITAHCVRVG